MSLPALSPSPATVPHSNSQASSISASLPNFIPLSTSSQNIASAVSCDPTVPPPTEPPDYLTVRISVPSQSLLKTTRLSTREPIWNAKLLIMNKIANELADALNYGVFMEGGAGRKGKFLDERRDLGGYVTEDDTLLTFIPKQKISTLPEKELAKINTKKNQKLFMELLAKGSWDKVKEKCSKGFDPNFWDERGETPLTTAVLYSDAAAANQCIDILVTVGAILDYRNAEWRTPLHVAAGAGMTGAVRTLLNYGHWPSAPNSSGHTPLFDACTNGHTDCVKILLNARCSPHELASDDKKFPLHQACAGNHHEIVSLLIEHGADMDVVNNVGNTPLHLAAARGAKESVLKLLEKGAYKEGLNESGKTAGQVAAMTGNYDLCEIIKNFNPDEVVPPTLQAPSLDTGDRIQQMGGGDHGHYSITSLNQSSTVPKTLAQQISSVLRRSPSSSLSSAASSISSRRSSRTSIPDFSNINAVSSLDSLSSFASALPPRPFQFRPVPAARAGSSSNLQTPIRTNSAPPFPAPQNNDVDKSKNVGILPPNRHSIPIVMPPKKTRHPSLSGTDLTSQTTDKEYENSSSPGVSPLNVQTKSDQKSQHSNTSAMVSPVKSSSGSTRTSQKRNSIYVHSHRKIIVPPPPDSPSGEPSTQGTPRSCTRYSYIFSDRISMDVLKDAMASIPPPPPTCPSNLLQDILSTQGDTPLQEGSICLEEIIQESSEKKAPPPLPPKPKPTSLNSLSSNSSKSQDNPFASTTSLKQLAGTPSPRGCAPPPPIFPSTYDLNNEQETRNAITTKT